MHFPSLQPARWMPRTRFGAISNPQGYNSVYADPHYNGVNGNQFTMERLQKACPTASETVVWDIGSGDGRNSIPMAKAGYQVLASEISDLGRYKTEQRAEREGVQAKVKTSKLDILNPVLVPPAPKIDFALMVHLSQHFELPELKIALTNIIKALTDKGIAIFDALIRKPEHNSIYLREMDPQMGTCHFNESDILELIQDLDCEAEVVPYKEPPDSQGHYVTIGEWGGRSCKSGAYPRPVDLKWFVARKKTPATTVQTQLVNEIVPP